MKWQKILRWCSSARRCAVAVVLAGSGLAAVGVLSGPAVPASAMPVLPVVSTGGYHSCVLMPDQTVWCWGQNIVGQLGDGTHTDSLVPVQVGGIPPATDVATGDTHSCAVDTTNQVWCWGSNAYGELGNGATSQDSAVPVHAQGPASVQVSAGHELSCEVTVFHFARCWGDNNYGELGDGTTSDSSKPVVVKNISNVVAVAAGYYHACAIESNGSLWCWGDNGDGELGVGATPASSDVPVQVPMQNVTQVAAGNSDTCAIGDAPGDLFCWGWNIEGELGDGTFSDRSSPTQVVGMTSGVQQVSVGNSSTCVIADNPGPTALCWGSENHGKLGDGLTLPDRPAPGPVFGLTTTPAGSPSGVTQIAAGGQHGCVVMTTALVQCFGDGFYGELGTGSSLDRHIPTPVIGLPGAAHSVYAVTAGNATSCAVTSLLEAFCWGLWVRGGVNPPAPQTTAVRVQKLPSESVSQVTAGWGGCALVRTGGLATDVRCWGDNKNGQLGDGSKGMGTDAANPVTVKNLSGMITQISSGGGSNCALVHNDGASCWGYNGYGELGDGTSTSSTVPVEVTGLPLNLAQISAGFDHACALLLNGSVRCWGHNAHGQLGGGSTSDSKTPVSVSGLAGVVQIAAGDEFTCALDNTGAVWCWGANLYGMLGDGTTTDQHTPVKVSALPGAAVSITASASSACAALIGGLLDCWGDNSVGELGLGNVGIPTMSSAPLGSLLDTDGVIGASAGFGGTLCGLDKTQHTFCWGYGADGELGDGTMTDNGTPVAVKGLP